MIFAHHWNIRPRISKKLKKAKKILKAKLNVQNQQFQRESLLENEEPEFGGDSPIFEIEYSNYIGPEVNYFKNINSIFCRAHQTKVHVWLIYGSTVAFM